jgi:hypothetical protein
MPLGTVDVANVDNNTLLPQTSTVADNLLAPKKQKLKGVPTSAQLTKAISDVQLNGSMSQVQNIVVTIFDQDMAFFRSGFLDTDENSKFDPIDVNFPSGSRFYWRLTIVSPSRADQTLTLTFMTRKMVEISATLGPYKALRTTMTRAEFLQSAVKEAVGSTVEFYCSELDVKQPIAASSSTSSASNAKAGSAAKAFGIGADLKGLTVKGAQMTTDQATILNEAFTAVSGLNPPRDALEAMVYAAMGESGITIAAGGGVWQDHSSPNPNKIKNEATAFMLGELGFQAGGAIVCANDGHPVWQIANEVEANEVWDTTKQDSYAHEWPGGQAQGLAEAKQIVAASGAIGSTATTTSSFAESYNYEINPRERFWDGMTRLAGDVNWPLFWDGDRLYYDSEQSLIRQKAAAVINVDDAVVSDWNGDWDVRQICTNMTLVLFDEPWQFRPGEVFRLDGFGTFSSGSSASPTPRPGYWLIHDLVRNGNDEFTTYTLVQPDLPKLEPAPQVGSTIAGEFRSKSYKTVARAYLAAQYLSKLGLIYSEAVRTLTQNITPFRGKLCYDCSASVSWVLLSAGFKLPGGVTWGGWAPDSGDYVPGAAGLVAGPGTFMTIYASPDHVFMRIHPSGDEDMQANTVNPGGAGFGFFPWGEAGASPDGGPNPGSEYTLMHYPGT